MLELEAIYSDERVSRVRVDQTSWEYMWFFIRTPIEAILFDCVGPSVDKGRNIPVIVVPMLLSPLLVSQYAGSRLRGFAVR